jgi:3-deoxy-7-phosphoheptulonate synthase
MKKNIWKILWAKELQTKIPLTPKSQVSIEKSRQELKDIISWKDNRKILIIWPCSADFEESLDEYAKFINELQKQVEDKIKIVMRFYTGKPRTVWGWKWLQNSKPWEKPNLITWIENSRKIAINLIEKYDLALADELLHPQLIEHIWDIYSYFAIWARSSENQFHREVSSWLDFPIWIKNPTSWSITIMINSILAWWNSSTYIIWNDIYETTWNSYCHAILRWWMNWPNYSLENIENSLIEMKNKNILYPWVIIDTNHDNSAKKYERQINIMQDVIYSISNNLELKNYVKWFMVESYLFDWRQDFSESMKKWLSLTDPCIWKEKTKELIESLYNLI